MIEGLGHYRVLCKLGEGGMGEVYRATDTRLGRDVALKLLPAGVARDPDRLARFQREAKALAALDHPNIVTVFSVEEADDVHFLTMQLVEGQSRRRAIEVHGRTNAPLRALVVSHALAGEHDEARQLLDDAAERGSLRYQSALTRALVHAACSEMDAAYESARRALDERDPLLMYLEVHPMFDGLRPDTRYPDLVRRMNLTQ